MVHSSGTGTGLGQDLSQIGPLEQKAQYKVTFTISNIVAGSGINVNLGCGNESTYIASNGTQTLYLTAGSCSSWIVFQMNSPSSSLTLDNVSVTKVSGGALIAKTVTADVLMPSSSGASALGTPENPWSRLALSGGSSFVNPLQVAGTGVLMKNVNSTGAISTYSANVPSGSELSLINLDFKSTQPAFQGSRFYGIRIITDSDAGDTAAGIAIGNNGPSDALYINNAGRGIGSPTGIGLDVNRNNYATYTGNGILSYDFSTVNSGATLIHLKKTGNVNTTNKMLHLEGNQNAIYLQTDNYSAGYDPGAPLIVVEDSDTAQPFIVTAGGNMTVGAITSGNVNGQTISSSANFTGTVTVATSVSTPTITSSGAGITFSSKNFTGVGTIGSGAITSTGAIQGNSLTAADVYGSSSVSGNLTLNSTSNVTKGKILFGTSAYDEANNRLGVGTNAPANKLTVNAPVTADALATTIITPTVATNKGLVVQGYTSQTADLIQGQSSAGAVLFKIDSSGNLTAKSATFTGTLTMNGHIITGNSSGSTTIAAGAGAGTGATVSITGNDTSGTITVTTGTVPTAGALATITFAGVYEAAPKIVFTPGTATATGLQYYYGSNATTFTLNTNNAPAASTAYTYSYMVMQ